jgi:nucleoid-associated protein YgaU
VAQLTFQRIDLAANPIDAPMVVTYAPGELAFTKAAVYADVPIPGLEQPLLQFVRGEAETLSMDLFFDSSAAGTGAGAVAVTEQVEAFHKLVSVNGDLHAPPLVRVTWGDGFPGVAMGDTPTASSTFTAVVTSVGRRFTLFSPDGKPLRATVSVALKHYATIAQQVATINYRSADHTRLHVVAEGETLPLIAHDAYADARRWRGIAEHNRLSQVRDLVPGTRLELPPLTTPLTTPGRGPR